MSMETRKFAFGDYLLDGGERVLLRGGTGVSIPPKIFDLLLILVKNHGHVVEKLVLMEELWPDTFVEDSNLTFSVRKLRQLLGDDTQHPKFIETIPKRGYRFISETKVVSGPEEIGDQITEPRTPKGLTALVRPMVAWAAVGGLLILGGLSAVYFARWYSGLSGVNWSSADNMQLTDRQGVEYFPSLSPDGTSFVYAAESESGFDVFHQRVGGRNGVNLTEDFAGNDTQPAFAPDGQRIAFRSERDGGGIYVMGNLKENLRRVSDFGFHPTWSPDGRFLAVSTFERDRVTVSTRGEHGIWVIDVESGEKREVFRGLASLPSWSAGGKRIAYWYYGNRSGQSDIATIPATGGDPVPVAEGFGSLNWNPVWSPDGKFLYFVSNRSGSQGFWRVRIDEETGKTLGDPEAVGTPSKFSRHLSFSRDGSRMIYVQSDLQSNIQGVEFDPENLAVIGLPFWITEGDREVSRAELSPDGTRFQTRLIRRTQDDIATVSRDGTDWRDVTNDLAFDRYSRWSPDGRRIAFTSDRSGDSEVWIVDADGTNPTQITSAKELGHISTFPVWSPDGSQILFSSPSDSYVLSLAESNGERQLTKLPRPENGDLFVPWDWSPDGKKLGGRFRIPSSGAGLFFFETGEFKRFSEVEDAVPSWLPDSRHVVFSEENKLILLDTETLQRRDLLISDGGLPRSPFLSRDGRLLYYVVHKNESDIWMLDLATGR